MSKYKFEKGEKVKHAKTGDILTVIRPVRPGGYVFVEELQDAVSPRDLLIKKNGDFVALDSAHGEEDEDDFDPEAEFDACPVVDSDDGETLDGDFKGHPFRGNQHKKASAHSHAAVRASMSAKHAEKDGDTKGAKSAHKSAHYSHMAAAEGATGKARKYHRKMAKFHGSRAGMTLDGVEGWDGNTLDDASDYANGNIAGVIRKGGIWYGRAVISSDGRAIVYQGKPEHGKIPVTAADGKPAQVGDDPASLVEWLLKPQAAPSDDFKPSDKWVKVSASEYRIVDLSGLEWTLRKKGSKWITDGGEMFARLIDAQKAVEDNIAQSARTLAEEAASRAEVEAMAAAKAKEPTPPVEVYAFKDASDEALGLLRIGAQNTATRSTYKTAVSVEQSAEARGMAIRWEAVSTLPTFDDAAGGLFGDGDQGHIRGDLTYNGTKLAQVYVREDGMAAFDYDKGLPEALGGAFDQFEDDYTGWNDAWDDVIYKLRNECDDRGFAQRPAVEFFIERLKHAGWSDLGTDMFTKSEDGNVAIEMSEDKNKWPKATLKAWINGAWEDMPEVVTEDARESVDFPPNASEDEVLSALSELLASAETLRIWATEHPGGAEPEVAPIDRLGLPPHRNYRVMRKSANSVKFNPLVGKGFTPDELAALYKWVLDAGFGAGKAENGVLVVGPDAHLIPGGADLNQREKSEKLAAEQAQMRSERDASERAEYESLPSAKWIDDQMGVEFADLYSRLKLARYLDGKDEKFTGMVSHKWLDPIKATGVEPTRGQSTAEILAALKSRYQAGNKPTPEPTVTPDPSIELPETVKASIGRLLAPVKDLAEALDRARKTDAKFGSEGRYGAESWREMNGDKRIADEAQKISSLLAGIPSEANRAAAAAYIEANRATPKLTGKESNYFAPDPAPAANAEDRAFFMSVIDGTHPEILEPELADKLAQAYERHAGDSEITSLFMQAGNAYTQAMLAATEGV